MQWPSEVGSQSTISCGEQKGDAKEEGKRKKRGSSEGEERATTHWNERRLK